MQELTDDVIHDIARELNIDYGDDDQYIMDFARSVIAADRAQGDAALVCDFCGCETPDPWHGSTEWNRHVHACDACRPKLDARHAEELAAYALTVANLHERKEELIASCVASELRARPEHKPMSLDEAWDLTAGCNGISDKEGFQLVRAAEAFHGIKEKP